MRKKILNFKKLKKETTQYEESANLRVGSLEDKHGWQTLGLTNQKKEWGDLDLQCQKWIGKYYNKYQRNSDYYKEIL